MIIPVWTPRDHDLLQLADKGSKSHLDTDNYGVSMYDFHYIQDYFKLSITVDAFASCSLHKTEKYFSATPTRDKAPVDFFMQQLMSEEIYFIHPPVSLLLKTLRHLELFPSVTAIVIVPVWKNKPFWWYLQQEKIKSNFIQQTLYFTPTFECTSKKCLFKDRNDILMMAMLWRKH